MINDNGFSALLEKYITGSLTPAERQLLAAWLDQPENAAGLEKVFKENYERSGEMQIWDTVQRQEFVKRLIMNRIPPVAKQQPVRLLRIIPLPAHRWWVAAAILLFLAAGGSFLLVQQKSSTPAPALTRQFSHDIVPGGNKAILTLANGNRIVLDSAHNGQLVSQGNSNVVKINSGLLAYNSLPMDHAQPSVIEYNTLSTPRGGQYQLALPDGSKVWLNTASSITFPTAFTGRTREVEITGEAYFEVAANSAMPFIVKSGAQQVEVLGTHFDISAFSDEKEIKTTLLEGSVKVLAGKEDKIIKPGQQARFSGNSIQVADVNTDEVIDWKNGYIQFDNEDIYSIMRKISRWYDVKVEYKGKINGIAYGGTVSREADISKVLEVLQATGTVHFKIEKRRIIVMP